MWSGYGRLFQTLHKNPRNRKLSKPLCRWSLYIQETNILLLSAVNHCNMFSDRFLSPDISENIINCIFSSFIYFAFQTSHWSSIQHRCIEINYETRHKHNVSYNFSLSESSVSFPSMSIILTLLQLVHNPCFVFSPCTSRSPSVWWNTSPENESQQSVHADSLINSTEYC